MLYLVSGIWGKVWENDNIEKYMKGKKMKKNKIKKI